MLVGSTRNHVVPRRKRPRKKAAPAPAPPRRAPKRAAPKAKKVDATFGTDPATETYGLENLGESQPMPLSIPVRLFAAVARAELVKDSSLDRKALMAKVEATAGCALKCGEFKAVCRLLAEKAASLHESEEEVAPKPKRRAAPKKIVLAEIAYRNRLLARPISLAETEIGCWMPTPRFLSPRLAL